MRLQIVSDLHLEFGGLKNFEKTGDVLLLAGDIFVPDLLYRYTDRYNNFFKLKLAEWDKVYMIAGNHEFYHGDIVKTPDIIREYLYGTNVTYLENDVVELTDDTVLFGGTFWTDFDGGDWHVKYGARKVMNDYHVIQNGDDTAVHPDYIEMLNMQARTELGLAIENYKAYNMVVMTHHGLIIPTPDVAGPSFRGWNHVDPCYYNTGMEFLLDTNVTHLIHGHTHDSYDYVRNGVRIVVNPRGYAGHALNKGFDPGFTVQI